VEPQPAVAVGHQRVPVGVQVEPAPKALHDDDGATPRRPQPTRLGPSAQVALHPAEQHAGHGGALVVAPGQGAADARRQGEHPLVDGYLGPDVIHRVRRALGHATPATRRAEPAVLTREGHQPFLPAACAAKAREPTGEPPTLQERVELVDDEARQPLPVADARHLGAERPVVIAHHLVQHRGGRVARRVRT
jgi:hypothetical protein